MAVHIRLARHGAKKCAHYRVVVADQRSPRDGRFIERVGTYDPRTEALVVDHGRVAYWRSQGAQASSTVDRLLKKHPAVAAQS